MCSVKELDKVLDEANKDKEVNSHWEATTDTNLEYCVFDMQCYECGSEIDYRQSDGNTCNCMCHELV